jgi:hypothetical protein
VPAGCRPHAEPGGYGGVGSIPEGRARRVPGADHHEGQGGSQRRGTRWMVSCEPPYVLRNFELGVPPVPEEVIMSVVLRPTATNGTRTGAATREPSHSGKKASRWVAGIGLRRPGPSGQCTCRSPRVIPPLCQSTTHFRSGLLPCWRHGMPRPAVGQWSIRPSHRFWLRPGVDATEGGRDPTRHPAVSLAGQGGVGQGTDGDRSGRAQGKDLR